MEFKRLFFDIETSPNIGFFWSTGYKLNIPHDNIIKERAIICICYKWEHEKTVHSLVWNKGDDRDMLAEFIEIMNSADEVVGQNSDNFDIKWLRTRCLLHGLPAYPEYQAVDTYKLAKKYFRFNSNKLDYMSSFLGFGNKIKTSYDLWKKIMLDNDETALNQMVTYCKKDVKLLAKVYEKLKPYVKPKTHIGVYQNNDKLSCPDCASEEFISNGSRTSSAGTVFLKLQCKNCFRFYSVLKSVYNKYMSEKNDKGKI